MYHRPASPRTLKPGPKAHAKRIEQEQGRSLRKISPKKTDEEKPARSHRQIQCTIRTPLTQTDFIQKISRVTPVTGLAELIWNALDADANSIEINLDEGEFGQERLMIRDNGTGFSHDEAPLLFGNLGNSWKRGRGVTKKDHRFLHGSEGQGRFKALGLGRVVAWRVIQATSGGFSEFNVWMAADRATEVHISELTEVDSAKPGVTVTVSELSKGFPQLKNESTTQALCEIFAIYLRTYNDVRISHLAGLVDPAKVIAASKTVSLPAILYGDTEYNAKLELIEWKLATERYLYFCDERGLSQGRMPLRLHVPGFNFSAHLQSPLVSKLSQDGVLGLEEMHPALAESLDHIGEEVKKFHRERLAEEAQAVVDTWKEERIYPFEGEPVTPVERIERQVFDIVASRVNQHLPDFTASGNKSKQFQLQMLRQAIEKSPEDLRRILTEILDLPQTERKELAELLEYVSFSGIIAASKLVADRLQFLAALEKLLFSPEEKKVLKERKQLHRLLAPHTWIFGEAFALSVDDRSLTEVLRKHLEENGRTDVDLSTPVLKVDGTRGIVDLMLSRRIARGKDDEREHLVIELKRPKLVVGSKELTQIKEYAIAVAKDERFRAVDATWHFWLLANDYDQVASHEMNQSGRSAGLVSDYQDPKIKIWAKTWAQVLEENRGRLRFVQEKLGYEPDYEQALKQLKATYDEIFTKLSATSEVREKPTEPSNASERT